MDIPINKHDKWLNHALKRAISILNIIGGGTCPL